MRNKHTPILTRASTAKNQKHKLASSRAGSDTRMGIRANASLGAPGRRDISCGTQQGGQLVHAGQREKPTGRGMGCYRPEVQGRSPVAIERSLQTLERPFPSSLHSDHLKLSYFR